MSEPQASEPTDTVPRSAGQPPRGGGPLGTSIRLTRSGGLAGLDMVASVDVDDLPAETASRVRSALARLDEERATTTSSAGPPKGADRYQYDLVVESGGERRSVTAHEGSLTPGVQALVDALMPLARPQ